MLTVGSLFSGVGGFELALERSGARCVWSAESDRQCVSVLKRHFSRHDWQLATDVRDVSTAEFVRPGIVTAGWPCQGNSVAGLRAGMADERSGLWSEVVRILRDFRPQWFLGENVPGLFSVNSGRDFRRCLMDLDELGFGIAWRCLDAQYFGLAQRRKRIFIVGCLGDVRRAAQVLFDATSVPWHPAPRRETRARVAASLTRGSTASSGVNAPGRRREDDVQQAAESGQLIAETFQNTGQGWWNQSDVGQSVRTPKGSGSLEANIVAHTLRGEGHDASEDGTGRGIPLAVAYAIQERAASENTSNGPQGKGWQEGLAYTLESRHHQQSAASRMGVRRLLPIECERLQGLPDDWTRYGVYGEEMSDSARYRMIGNGLAINCVEWIGRRIVEAHEQPEQAR